jgi:hypothetical protein
MYACVLPGLVDQVGFDDQVRFDCLFLPEEGVFLLTQALKDLEKAQWHPQYLQQWVTDQAKGD